MEIIIIGAGKAGYLHLNSYLKIIKNNKINKININKIYIFDPQKNNYINTNLLDNKKIDIIEFYSNFKDLLYKVSPNSIVDICVPAPIIEDIMDNIISFGFTKLIVEKPCIVESNKLKNIFSKIQLFIIENYLYSQVTKEGMLYLKNKASLPDNVTIEFSKNRLTDSLNKRGFYNGKAPLVWQLEFPHMIYLCNYLFGNLGKITFSSSSDLIINNQILKNHNSGTVHFSNLKTIFKLVSNLSYPQKKRFLKIDYSDKTSIIFNYSNPNSNEYGFTELNNYGEVIYQKRIENDDMMYTMLLDYLIKLNTNEKINNDRLKRYLNTGIKLKQIIGKEMWECEKTICY
ncbi:MAG TPA: hypothetical protein PKA28_16620 [Methylomusa anaerophila]|uniref:Gfo/Idh/MocA-like oxidoreductase N-terminal domain-containing protein n=1 Tax=Methylomusa anaerophila TaxID=1930071 RepID=A0A348AER8_9FIRM|nr:hypothetical protein [Methylomusa anaerophila]BBB89566.1 hypothetical protein MAMMFC1_00199 [Methylomusa anaerophila]HML90066.1 hypothetical protein [Methylomusa anaerophila]